MADRIIRDWAGVSTEELPPDDVNARVDRLEDASDRQTEAIKELVKLLGTVEVSSEPASTFWREFGRRLSSRKFLLTVAALLTIVGNWIAGTVNDQTAILGIVGALTAFIGGQAYQDAKTAGK